MHCQFHFWKDGIPVTHRRVCKEAMTCLSTMVTYLCLSSQQCKDTDDLFGYSNLPMFAPSLGTLHTLLLAAPYASADQENGTYPVIALAATSVLPQVSTKLRPKIK